MKLQCEDAYSSFFSLFLFLDRISLLALELVDLAGLELGDPPASEGVPPLSCLLF